MSQPANDDFSQHLSDDEASYHKDASDNVSAAVIHAVEKGKEGKEPITFGHFHFPRGTSEKIHGLMDGCTEIWEAIRTRFGGNANSKKMQKAVLKQLVEKNFYTSSEGLEKGYDRTLISVLLFRYASLLIIVTIS
ncbi:hypothetical protein Tco_0830963 [Tanacetum coccineum]